MFHKNSPPPKKCERVGGRLTFSATSLDAKMSCWKKKKRKESKENIRFIFFFLSHICTWFQQYYHSWLCNDPLLVSAQTVSGNKPIWSKFSSTLWANSSHSLPARWQFIARQCLEDVPRYGRSCICLHNINVIWHLWHRHNCCFPVSWAGRAFKARCHYNSLHQIHGYKERQNKGHLGIMLGSLTFF